tara:strand:+ start:19214 stop:21487 length:2274 start_codon:yes stop_codon:yes gene_type:complete
MPQRNVATNFTFEQQRQEINLLAADFTTFESTVNTAAPTYLKHDGSNDFTGQTLAVPNAFTINSNSGSGTVTISGNLNVTGTTTTVNTTNLEITDKNILISKGSTSDAQADGAGITIDSATDITFNFVDANDALVSSIGLEGTTFLKAPRGQFTGNTSPTTGSGVEINAPDANTGQIISYDRGTTAYKELRVKGSSVGIYGGTTNALVGSFSSTGLSVTGTISSSDDVIITGANKTFKAESSSSGDYVRMYAGSGTGQWDIYGNGDNLRFSDNASAGSVIFDRNVDANSGLDVSGALNIDGNSSNTTQFSGYDALRIHNANGSALGITADMYFTVGTGTTNRGASIGVEYSNPGPGNALYFATNPNAITSNDTLEERMRITPDGKVGINYTSPDQAVLEVQGAQEFASSANDLATSVTKAALRVKGATNSSDSLWIGVETVNAFPYLQGANGVGNNAKNLLLNPFGGKVGINETNPQGFLDVRSTTDLGSIFRRDYGGVVSNDSSKLAMTIWGQDHDQSVNGTGTDQSGPMIGFGGRIDDANPNIADIRAGISYSYNGNLTFHAKSGSNSGKGITDGSHERLRIDGTTGNLLIGSNNSKSYHNAAVSVSANTSNLLELRTDDGTDTNYVKRWAHSFVRATSESTHDILTLTNTGGNSHVVIELKMYCVAAANAQAGIITAYADARRTGSDSGYTLGQQTPSINFIVGTSIAVGSLAWTSNGAGGGTLKYTTDANNNYVKYNVEITVWAHDRMNITFP